MDGGLTQELPELVLLPWEIFLLLHNSISMCGQEDTLHPSEVVKWHEL